MILCFATYIIYWFAYWKYSSLNWHNGDFQSQKWLHSQSNIHPSVCLLVHHQNPSTAYILHLSSFNLHHSTIILHCQKLPNLQLLSHSACFHSSTSFFIFPSLALYYNEQVVDMTTQCYFADQTTSRPARWLLGQELVISVSTIASSM